MQAHPLAGTVAWLVRRNLPARLQMDAEFLREFAAPRTLAAARVRRSGDMGTTLAPGIPNQVLPGRLSLGTSGRMRRAGSIRHSAADLIALSRQMPHDTGQQIANTQVFPP
jgi:hypothetical protein